MWLIPETAPKDGAYFLADFGWPWPVMCCWNACEKQFVYANPCNQEIENRGLDPYYETEYEDAKELKRWRPLPDMREKLEKPGAESA